MMPSLMTPLPVTQDAELVNASLAGRREAFEQIVVRYQALVCSLAYSATGSLSHSEDLAQETFLTAWRQLSGLREPPKLRAWLCGIARNLINQSLRAQDREPSHHAEPLEEIGGAHAPEPLPVDQVIDREEADILWRALERIPEIYREPLVLYYREHQSAEAVARNLELTEEAVRQRLARGRKLLQEEVLAFVETALERTAPGRTFTQSVVGALPLAASAAQTAAGGLAAAKSGAGLKSLLTLGPLSGFIMMLGTIFYSWKALVDDSKSPRERRFTRRMAVIQIAVFLILMAAAMILAPILFARHPLIFGIAYAGMIVWFAVNTSVMTLYLTRRRLEIQMEDGTIYETAGNNSQTRQKIFQRTNRISLIWLLIFALGCLGFPWKHHSSRSLICVAAGCLVFAWSFRQKARFQKSPAGTRLWISRFPIFARYPVAAALVQMVGVAFLCGIICLVFPFFLNPEGLRPGLLGSLGRGVGVGLLGTGIVVLLLFVGRRLGLNPLKIGLPILQGLISGMPGIGKLVDKTYGPVFDRLQLTPQQRTCAKGMILDKTMVGVRLGLSLAQQKPDAAKRAVLLEQMKTETAKHDARLREFLGEAGYQTFRDYEKTIPDRTLVNQFASKHSGTALAPSAAQQEELHQQMSAVRARCHWSTPLSRRDQTVAEFLFGSDSESADKSINTFATEEAECCRQILIEAGRLLSPDQIAVLRKLLEQQRQTQLQQMKISAKLVAPAA